jgi:hypothetical protein
VLGVTVKDVVAFWFTVCGILGLIVPPVPANGVTLYVGMGIVVTLKVSLTPPMVRVAFVVVE